MFEAGLAPREANYVPLTPIDFIARTAEVYGDRLAMVHGDVRRNWGETYARTRRLASALQRAGSRVRPADPAQRRTHTH
jgi:fatty-acyl-CoA synthase